MSKVKNCPFSVIMFNKDSKLDQYKATAYENAKSEKCLKNFVQLLYDFLDYNEGRNNNMIILNYNLPYIIKNFYEENVNLNIIKWGGYEKNSQNVVCSKALTEKCIKISTSKIFSKKKKKNLTTTTAIIILPFFLNFGDSLFSELVR